MLSFFPQKKNCESVSLSKKRMNVSVSFTIKSPYWRSVWLSLTLFTSWFLHWTPDRWSDYNVMSSCVVRFVWESSITLLFQKSCDCNSVTSARCAWSNKISNTSVSSCQIHNDISYSQLRLQSLRMFGSWLRVLLLFKLSIWDLYLTTRKSTLSIHYDGLPLSTLIDVLSS